MKILVFEDIDLLKFGRHFRLPDGSKLVVGRHKDDNESLKSLKNSDYIPIILPITGPFSFIYKDASRDDKELGAKIAITYAKSKINTFYDVKVGNEIFKVIPLDSKIEAQKYFIY